MVGLFEGLGDIEENVEGKAVGGGGWDVGKVWLGSFCFNYFIWFLISF